MNFSLKILFFITAAIALFAFTVERSMPPIDTVGRVHRCYRTEYHNPIDYRPSLRVGYCLGNKSGTKLVMYSSVFVGENPTLGDLKIAMKKMGNPPMDLVGEDIRLWWSESLERKYDWEPWVIETTYENKQP